MLDFFIDLDSTDLRIVGKKNESQSVSGGKIASIFTAIEANLNADLVSKTGAIFQFNVKGN